jgi:hypothetical protein
LLQNWWKSKPFVEVSAEYLAECNAIIDFCTKKPTAVPKKWRLNPWQASEFLDDTGDKWNPEK